MPMRSTFEISTQIILLKIDGFLKGWILNITPLKNFKFTKKVNEFSKLSLRKSTSKEIKRIYLRK